MTIITNAFSTYDQVGAKEQVSNLISNIAPAETPFFSSLKKFSVQQKLHQWQTDSLAIPAANAQLEGDSVSAGVSSATTLLNNVCQISYKALSVSDSAQATAVYGRANDYDYQVMKKGKELKLDIEYALLKNTAKISASASTGTARATAGLCTWITNVVNGTAPAGTGAGTASAASATALTYEYCASAMQLAYVAGGNPTVMMTTPALKRKFSGLAFASGTSTAVPRFNLSTAKAVVAVGAVEQWLSDFGTIDVVPNRQMSRQTTDTSTLGTAVFFLEPGKARVGWLQPIEVIPLAKTGLADNAVIRGEYVLEVSNPAAHAAIYGMT